LKVECLEKQVIVHELPSSMDFKILDPPPWPCRARARPPDAECCNGEHR
jgi:hypothetical protein